MAKVKTSVALPIKDRKSLAVIGRKRKLSQSQLIRLAVTRLIADYRRGASFGN